MNLVKNIYQGYKTAKKDRKQLMDLLRKEIRSADYYREKYLKEEELFLEIEYPIQIIYRSIGKSYWKID